jgi:hypothetical protein
MLWQAVEKVSNRHSGRNEGANPESSHTDFLRILDSGSPLARRPE